jgi:hypothetical protein
MYDYTRNISAVDAQQQQMVTAAPSNRTSWVLLGLTAGFAVAGGVIGYIYDLLKG